MKLTSAIAGAALGLLACSMSAQANTYNVNRSWIDGVTSASLVGTVDVALGSYTITNGGASPFDGVNLTLSIGGTSYSLTQANTSLIFGTGQFFVDANASDLIFRTANADGYNPADLRFFNTDVNAYLYAIGSDALPGFETAIVGLVGGSFTRAAVTFPVVFGTAAVPTPATVALLALGLVAVGATRRRQAVFGTQGELA